MLVGLTLALAAPAVSAPVARAAGPCPLPTPPPASAPVPTAAVLAPPPGQVIACAGAEAVTGTLFSHWANVAEKAEGAVRHPPGAATVIEQVMGFLLSSDWILEEASRLRVNVSQAAVRHTFDRLRGQGFHSRRQFRAFLRSSGETVGDLLLRVRLNLLSERIERHVVAGHRSAASQQRALSGFVRAFKTRWRAQTFCAAQYEVADCGHSF